MGARHIIAHSAEELMEAFTAAHLLRSTKATERNSQSSRSHSITRLTFLESSSPIVTATSGDGTTTSTPPPPPSSSSSAAPAAAVSVAAAEAVEGEADKSATATTTSYGELTLVDLAGSERNEDTQTAGFSVETALESASINASLMTLKVCVY